VSPSFGGVYFAGRESAQWVDSPQYGVPFISGGDLQKADLTDTSFISKMQVETNPAFLIHKGMTLITRSGSIGKTAYARADMDGMTTSDPLRVVPDPNKIPSGYLYAFLSSKFGVPLIASGASGAVIKHLDPVDILEIPVPRLSDALEDEIHELVEIAGQSLTTFGQLLRKATESVLQETGIADIPRHEWLEDSTRFGWSQTGIRSESLRALNYDRRLAAHFKKIRAGKHSQLGDLCDPEYFHGHTVFTRIDSDEEFGVKLVGQREAFRVWPEGRTIARSSIEGLGLLVQPGTTLIPSHGTFGEFELYCRAAYVTKRTSAYAFSGDFYRCVPRLDTIPPGYLFAFMRSEVAFRMLRSISAGGKQQYQHPTLMYELPIPRLDKSREKEIGKLIDRAATEFDHALDCEEKARQLLEQKIESFSTE
jgi:type I restriction enzyme S subunit